MGQNGPVVMTGRAVAVPGRNQEGCRLRMAVTSLRTGKMKIAGRKVKAGLAAEAVENQRVGGCVGQTHGASAASGLLQHQELLYQHQELLYQHQELL